MAWRHLGPANPMGRMTDIAVHDRDQSTWFVGTAGGGLWRTKNAGTTWQCVFNQHGTVSIGDVAIAPSDARIVWIGTGEENARNWANRGATATKSRSARTCGRRRSICAARQRSWSIASSARRWPTPVSTWRSGGAPWPGPASPATA
jgi:hypothetical protein